MILGVIQQQPIEVLDYDVDCKSLFNSDSDALATAVASVEPAGLTVTAAVADATTAKLWVSGGVDGTNYIVELTVTSTSGRKKQDEFEVIIEEVD